MKNAILILISLLVFTGVIEGKEVSNYKEKEIEDFKPLSEFSSVEEFERSYESYIQSCLDNRPTDNRGRRCYYFGWKIWDREIDIYYKKIDPLLSKDGKELLKKSQLSYHTARTQSVDFNSFIIKKEYAHKRGNMYLLFMTADAYRAISPISKQRALLLKRWYEYISEYKAASFDCDEASTSHEKMICNDSTLGALDEEMGRLYKQVLALDPQQLKEQRKFNKKYKGCRELDKCIRLVEGRNKVLDYRVKAEQRVDDDESHSKD